MTRGRARFPRRLLTLAAILSLSPLGSALAAPPAAPCSSTVTAQVVALDTAIFANRMGAQLPDAMIFALAGDVQPIPNADDGSSPTDWTTWTAGKVELKGYKRPRPLVLRVNAGQCLQVQFRNLVSPTVQGTQPSTRATSLHVQGLNWLQSPADDGSWIGANASSLSNPGDPVRTYNLYAPEEGPFLLYSTGDVASFSGGGSSTGSQGGDGGQLQQGLFGAVNVEPATAEQYRSQVNHEDLCLATVGSTWQNNGCTAPAGAPKINYQATYPAGHPRAGLPILRMTQTTANGTFLVHSDLTAIISGPNAGPFASTTAPGLSDTPTSPDRQEPFREFTIIYHEMVRTTQAFTELYAAPQLGSLMESANDNFAINYGMGGIGSEILANRLGRGPAGECLDCKYEEFFLSSWTNGDPAMVVDVPADQGCAIQDATQGYPSFACPQPAQATKAYYPDDPSNVYHSYLWDHTRFRILHGGSDLHHIHHLHAHQWLHTPNTSSGHYLDSQAIGPGAAFTLEMVYNGSGNKNLTVGDSIFHCHFYPHFAAGMWSLWRVHDVFEAGTQLDGYPGGKPAQNARALPDGEIATGTPIPGLVPISTNALAPPPAPVRLTENGTVAEVCTDGSFSTCVSALSTQGNPEDFENPGYPFFIPGMAGSRSPHPPMDFALACSNSGAPCDTAGTSCGAGGTCQAIDGGLPRHIVQAEAQVNKFSSPAPADPNVATPAINPLDFSKEVLQANGIGLPEQGTVVEQVAMQYHARRTHPSQTPGGTPADFVTNGRPPRQGAPYADPCIDIEGTVPAALRNLDYWGVDFQTDAVFNKEGWHFPQQRMIALWGDLFDFLGLNGGQKKAPEPFFIRANSNDCVHYRLANLIPKTFELDDFQVRTPTDILGQHIHLVKFDVTSSDGGANGFNYEDGTLAPDEVVERINAFNNGSWKASVDSQPSTTPLAPAFIKFFGADPSCADDPDSPACQCQVVEYQENGHTKQGVKGGRWCGAQATVQTWYVDPTLNNAGQDLTLRTVFTHDHFGPSTHQQAGVYAALVSEPQGSTWHDNQTGDPLGGRTATQNGVSLQDGGPTSWQAVIQTTSQPDSFREFLFALQDSTLMYRPFPASVAPPACPAGSATCGFCSTAPTQACSLDPTSPIYWETVCTKVVSLPNPKNLKNNTQGFFAATQLQPSCNFVPGIPSRNSLFFQTASGTNPGNIWGGVNADLTALGWDTLPIMPAPKGVFVSQTTGPQQTNPAQPELITLDGATQNFSVNYRNEPIYPRIYSNGSTTAQDLATVYQSLPRTLPGAVAPSYAPLTAGVGANDPFTPLLRANAGDNVQVRLVVGAHQNPHNFTLHGNKWLFEPSNVNSGWRGTQTMGISEHFEFLFRVPGPWTPPSGQQALASTDYLYRPTAAKQGQMSGSWGILRAYNSPAENLFPVPGAQAPAPVAVCPAALMSAQCGADDGQGHTLRCYDVVAARVQDAFKTTGKQLMLNTKLGWQAPNSVLYFLAEDYAKLQAGQAVPGIDPATGLAEPLVLRAAAGDCIQVNLKNEIPSGVQLGQGFASSQLPVDGLAGQPASARGLFVPSNTSTSVGLHPQLVAYDATRGDGMNVGDNPVQTAAPGQSVTYRWYAGAVDGGAYTPVELGAANLLPADPVNHHPYNLFAALVIEPEGATWTTDPNSRASATVTAGDLTFREQVLVMQDDGVIFTSSGVRQVGGGAGAFNLRTEPLTGQAPFRQCTTTNDQSCVFSNQAVCNGSACGNPQTPIFCAQAGQEARIRLLHPGGAVTNNIFEVFGHTFAEEPYTTAAADCQAPTTHANVNASGVIQVGNQCPDGTVTVGPSLTEWKGSRNGHGPTNHFDVVIQKAGGQNGVAGDYLYRSFPAPHVNSGIWGLFRVTPGAPTAASCPSFTTPGTAP